MVGRTKTETGLHANGWVGRAGRVIVGRTKTETGLHANGWVGRAGCVIVGRTKTETGLHANGWVGRAGRVMVGRTKTETGLLRLWRNRPFFIFGAFLVLCFPELVYGDGWGDWWFTGDQQGQRLMAEGRYLEAAAVFESPDRRGAAFFRGGDFESAASVYGRLRTPGASYNRGNALIMLGRYDEAIASFDEALKGSPDWTEAQQNRAIAIARKERLAPPDDDAGGTGGQMGADEIVFDDSGRVNKSGAETESVGSASLSDDEMRAVWLRRVQNDPAQFLRTRFSYQLFREQQRAQAGEGSDGSLEN